MLRIRHVAGKIGHAVPVKLNHFPRTRPYAFPAVRASLVDDPNVGFEELDSIFRAHADTASTVVAFPRDNVNHQRSRTLHNHLVVSGSRRS